MSPIATLAVACATFVGTHLLLSHPLRPSVTRAMGEGGFRILYSLIALLSFGWIIWAWLDTPASAPAYMPSDAVWAIASLLMWFASVLLIGSFAGNPAMPGPGASAAALRRPMGVFAITRHPMMWSFAIWAVVHLLLWATPENHVLSTTILVLALVGSAGQDAKKARLMGDSWRGWTRRTAFFPFAGQISGRIPWGEAWPGAIALIGGTLIWLLFTWMHEPFGGRMAAGLWRWIGT
jgi:uncharacterized membrane protein